MKYSGKILERDYVAAQYLHLKPRKTFAFIGIALLILATISLIVSFSWVMLACLAYLFGYYFLFIPWQAAKSYRQYKAMQELITFEFRDSGIFSESKKGSGIIEWNEIIKIKNNKKLLLVYPTNTLFHIFPNHFFQNDEEFDSFVEKIKSEHEKT